MTLSQAPQESRDIIGKFLALHDAKRTAYTVDAKANDMAGFFMVTVHWNQYGQFGDVGWARLDVHKMGHSTVARRVHAVWECKTWQGVSGHVFSTCPKAGHPVERSEWVAGFLERFRV